MTSTGQEPATGSRIHFLDNVRTAMIFLVVLYHSGAVYESSGFFASFWLVDDPSTNDFVGILNVVIDIFVMSVIFFISGYFAPVSLKRSPGWTFVASRFRRLMVPWLVAVLTLIPLYKVIFLYSRGLPQEHWSTYFHFSNGIFSQNWLWFLPVLFLFDALFWGLAKARIRPPEISLKAALAGVFVLGVAYSYAMSVLGLTGWTKTFLVDFQNERLFIYLLMFLLGALCFKLKVFAPPPGKKWPYIAAACTAWIPMNVYVIVLLTLLFRPGEYFVSLRVDLLVMWCAFHVSLLTLLYLTLNTFRFWLNGEGRLGRLLNPYSYAVYILHVPVLGLIALTMLGTGIPSLGRYAILTVSTYVLSNALAYGYREILKPRLVA